MADADANNNEHADQGDQENGEPNRKYTRRNFEDGHIVYQLREGRERSDTYLKRTKTLVKGCRQVHTLTNCHVKLQIIPTWSAGKSASYTSPGFPETGPGTPISTPTRGPPPPERRSPRKSPQKRLTTQQEDQRAASSSQAASSSHAASSSNAKSKSKKKTCKRSLATRVNKDICGICGIEYESEADITSPIDSSWLNCSVKNCEYWIHNACAGIYYPTSKKGVDAMDKWAASHFFCRKHIAKQ